MLLLAATISLIIGILEEPQTGWIEGSAIFVAVFLVAIITTANQYSSQLQFRDLEKSSSQDERCSVFRDYSIRRLNPSELVVGDILVLQIGDMVITKDR